jgi:hypothetical protein
MEWLSQLLQAWESPDDVMSGAMSLGVFKSRQHQAGMGNNVRSVPEDCRQRVLDSTNAHDLPDITTELVADILEGALYFPPTPTAGN